MRVVVATVALGVLLLPLASAQDPGGAAQLPPGPDRTDLDIDGPTTLYFHLINVQDFPINTQEPAPTWTEDVTYGSLSMTTSCLGAPGNVGGTDREYHTYRGYISPALVEYDNVENGVPRTHPERGMLADAVVSGDPVLYWYLAADANLPSAPAVPAPIPNVRIEATWRPGDQISIDNRAYDSGELLMHGSSVPATLLGPQVTGGDGQVRAMGQVDGKWIYEFAVPIQVEDPTIPRAQGANLRVDVLFDNPACSDPQQGYLMPNVAVAHSSAGFRPRMDVRIATPLSFEYLAPQWVGDDLVFHASIVSPWGAYDVDRATLAYELVGPTPATTLALVSQPQRFHEHSYGPEAATMAFVWPEALDIAEPGDYTFFLRAKNLQGSASLEGEKTVQVGGAAQELPSLTLPVLAMTMFAAAFAIRRRD